MTNPADNSKLVKEVVTTIVAVIALVLDIVALVEKHHIWAIAGLVVSVIGVIIYLLVKHNDVMLTALIVVVVVVVAGLLVTIMVWPTRVTGMAFFDSNGNGRDDTSEMPAADIKLELENSKGGLYYAVTDAQGVFVFEGIRKGSYTIRIVEYNHIGEIGLLELEEKIGIPIAPTGTPTSISTSVIIATEPSPLTPTPITCPYQGMTDSETIVNLIQAEAAASNAEDITIMQSIFAPETVFSDYVSYPQNPPKIWVGPLARYQDDLFTSADFMQVEHFDILPVRQGINENMAWYTSGSKGFYRINGGEWIEFFNGSLISTPPAEFGSEHWILKKNSIGCWAITQMEFDAGHVKFPR